MTDLDELRRENDALRNRISRLSTAILRINASLDLNTVLHEVVDSACALTGACCGGITTVDENGQPQNFVTSGLTPEEHRKLVAWPDGPRLLEHLRSLPDEPRLGDLPAYLQGLGLAFELIPSQTLRGTSIRHSGRHVGDFFLGDKEPGRQFTREDEEVLRLFASQAGAAIANARTHQDERRARADLEALVETSPVGVAVFDARTGKPLSFNREARRIVEALNTPGRAPEELLQLVTCQRADGREVSLTEFPLAQLLGSGETVRAEEMLLSVPDGRRVRTLVNATPIRAGAGEVESLVVTMQDLAPLEELERSRAEFLSMVSHELRAPLTSVKGSTATVLSAAPSPDPAEMLQFFRIIDQQADHMRALIGDLLDVGRIDAGTLAVAPEPVEVASLVEQARNTFSSGGAQHPICIDLPSDLPWILADARRIVQVLNNLFANASRHSPESSPIRVAAVQDGPHVAISVTDAGSGVPPDLLPRLFRKRVSADRGKAHGADAASGLGLNICKGIVEAHGGRIWAEGLGADPGTRFTFTLPVADGTRAGTADRTSRSDTPRRTGREPARVLVVDDDPHTLRYVRAALQEAGYVTLATGDPREVPDLIRTHRPQLVLLDLLLPGSDGIELMQRVPDLSDLPVIFISAYGRDETIARALEVGAADYIVKPFSSTELAARVRAALRRRTAALPFLVGDLAIDYEQRRTTVAGRTVHLTATEYALLHLLSVNAGRVLTYDSLLRQVWSRQASADSRPVRSCVKRLRRKLGDSADEPAYILNERGVGYRMPLPDDA